MKTKLAILTAATLLAGSHAWAADLSLSSSTSNNTTPNGATIPWNTTDTYWWNGSSNVAWTNNNTVVFTGVTTDSNLNTFIDPTVTGITVNAGRNLRIANTDTGNAHTVTVEGAVNVATNRNLEIGTGGTVNITMTGNMTKTGAGSFILNTANAILAGNTDIQAGALTYNAGTMTNAAIKVSGTGQFVLNGSPTIAKLEGTGNTVLLGTTGSSKSLTIAQTADTTYSGNFVGGGSGGNKDLTIVKNSSGTLLLTGDNSGMLKAAAGTAVTVSGGTLTAGSNNALGGGGSFGNNVSVGASGRLGVANQANASLNNLTLATGSKFLFDLTGAASTTDTQLLIGGTWTGTGNYTIDLLGTTGLAAGNYTLIDMTTSSTIGAAGFTQGTGWGSNTLSWTTDQVILTVIPEPTTWALLAGSLTTVVIFRRRRRNLD